jgi:dipeptide/tripeptide permease
MSRTAAYVPLPTDATDAENDHSNHVQAHDDAHSYAPEPPTSAQLASLRRVPAAVPGAAYALALVELAERASYYGVGGVFTNFVQRPLPRGSTTGAPVPGAGGQRVPGALGMGIRVATGMSTLFTLLAFTSPLVKN